MIKVKVKVKVKSCSMLLLFLFGFLLIYVLLSVHYVPLSEAETDWGISCLQNTFLSWQSGHYTPLSINSWNWTFDDPYYSRHYWGDSFFQGLKTSIPWDAAGFPYIKQGIWPHNSLSSSFSSSNGYTSLIDIQNANSWTQINSWNWTFDDPYYSRPYWGDSFFEGLKTPTPWDAAVFSNIEQDIRSQDFFSNSSRIFNNYGSLLLSTQINQAMDFLNNSYWGYNGILFPWTLPIDHLSQGRAYFLRGEYESAIRELEGVTDLSSAKEEIYLLLGMSYQALGSDYLKEAEEYLKKAVDFQLYSPTISLQLAKVYYQQGKYNTAIEEYNRVIEKEPENGEAVKGLALSYFKANDLTRALRELQKAEMMNPDDPETLWTIALVFEEKHLFTEATEYNNKVINLAPDSSWAAQARDHLHEIGLVGGASGIEDIKEEEIAMLIMSAPEPEDMPGHGLIVLLDETQYQILPDDTLINRTHKLFKILNDHGKEASEIKLSYDSTFENITIDLARVIKPDGTIIGAGQEDIQEVTPWANFPLYNNVKVLIISMPGVTVGSVIEYQVTTEDIPGSRRFDPREIDVSFALAATSPVKRARLEVLVPADREFEAIIVNGEPLDPEVVVEGEMKRLTWRLNDLPGAIVEPMMPPVLDISPILYLTSFPSWKIIADWWRELEFQAIVSNNEIRSKVNELTQNLSTQKDKARALYHYVASQIRYVGLEYGKGDVRPYPASQVYEDKYGDCKNKTILLITMLREVGIDAYPGLVSTLYNGRAWEEIPRVNAFNHVITLAIIEDEWIWMDTTIETASFGEIPAGIQDRETLAIFDEGYKLMRIPVVTPEKNMDQEIMNVQIAQDSTATVSSITTSKGINTITSRAYFKALEPIYIKRDIETIIAGRATGGKLIDFQLSDVDDLNEPYKLETIYTHPDYITWADDIGFIKASSLSVKNAAIIEERSYPVFLGNTSLGECIAYINLPENIKVRYLPPSLTLEIPQISCISEYTLKDHTIAYHLRYEIREIYIPLEDYDKYKEFQERVDKELERKIIVEKIAP